MKLDLSKEYEQNKARHYIESWIDKGAKVEIKRIPEKRTLSQNAYFHVLVEILGNDLGYTKDEMKQVIKQENKSLFCYEKDEIIFYRGTRDLSKEEMTKLIDWMRLEWPYLPDSVYVQNNWASLQVELSKYGN